MSILEAKFDQKLDDLALGLEFANALCKLYDAELIMVENRNPLAHQDPVELAKALFNTVILLGTG